MDPVEGWVEVRDEPRHRRRFEDEHIRMYDVLVAPGDTTLFHRHTEDTLYISINDARVQDRTWGSEEARTGDAPAGLCLCRPHRARPLIHQVTNVGDGPMRMIGAEIKASPPLRRGSPLEAAHHTLALERDRVRVYALDLAPGASTGSLDYGFAAYTVFLTVATVQVRDGDGTHSGVQAPGDVWWRPDGFRGTIANIGEEPLRALVAEWR
ncbi:MAG: hypothetical protein IT196_01960 [Acidimicrobiales bacterium]|nr:hypothetical protein [Acidimicrobiales bacterium]